MTPERAWLPARAADAHKDHFGHVLVIGGSRGFLGAPRLAAVGALRGGAGLVTMAVPESLEPVAATGPWEAMTLGLPEKAGGLAGKALALAHRFIENRRVTAVALGPGLGQARGTGIFVRGFLAGSETPTILDADGLNAVAGAWPREVTTPLVLTPHPGEMARLLGTTSAAVQKDRRGAAREAARRFKSVVVLKGSGTVVTDGEQEWINSTGNPGLASGGTGDVLAGLLAALVAQVSADELPERLWRAAVLAVYLHGLAGDLAVRDEGPVSLLAGDVAAFLPKAFRRLLSRPKR